MGTLLRCGLVISQGTNMTPYNKLSKQKRKIIDIFRDNDGVVNSFYLKITKGIVQVSVRIMEMRDDGWPFLPKDKLKHYKDGSVDYVLQEKPEVKLVTVFKGSTAYSVTEEEYKKMNEPVQESLSI